jgi:hypothetical protein
MSNALLDLLAREHPAFVHLPLGLVLSLPVALLASFRSRHAQAWKLTAVFAATLAWLGSVAALLSGLLWGRLIALIPPGGFLPVVLSDRQVLQRMLRLHEGAALAGTLVGAACLLVLWKYYRQEAGRPGQGRALGTAALLLGLGWLGAWGLCGKLGGIMVFGNEETNRAAAAAEAKRKNDVEADLPIRALDYASLEAVEKAPVRSPAHGNRWRRVWVTASGIDAYREGRPLPPGAYAVLTTFEDGKGRPSHEPGPIYMKEAKADGSTAFAFYWPKVPDPLKAQFGGEDSVYWRSPDPRLAVCLGCHEKGGTGGVPGQGPTRRP